MPVAAAMDTALYGKWYVRADEVKPPVDVQAPAPLDPAQVAALENQLEENLYQDGPYAPAAAETLLAMARLQVAVGNYAGAIGAYQRALHLQRVNEGLDSPAQVPTVRAMLDTYWQAGELEALDDSYGYFFRLFGGGQPPFTDLKLTAALEYLQWQRQAYILSVGNSGNRRLVDLYLLNRDILDDLVLAEVAPQWQLEFLLSQAANTYLIHQAIEAPDPLLGQPGDRREVIMRTQSPLNIDPDLERLLRLRQSSGVRLRVDLEEASERFASEPLLQARVLLAQGDWMLWNGRSTRADGHYQQIFDSLAPRLPEEWLQATFDEARELPAGVALWSPRQSDGEVVQLRASFEVDARGRVRRVRARASDDQSGPAARLRRLLGDTVFRPRYVNGEAVASVVTGRKYLLRD